MYVLVFYVIPNIPKTLPNSEDRELNLNRLEQWLGRGSQTLTMNDDSSEQGNCIWTQCKDDWNHPIGVLDKTSRQLPNLDLPMELDSFSGGKIIRKVK
jgi:hypothetical protein